MNTIHTYLKSLSFTFNIMYLQFCSGGELFDYIVAKERLKASDCSLNSATYVSVYMYCIEKVLYNNYIHVTS